MNRYAVGRLWMWVGICGVVVWSSISAGLSAADRPPLAGHADPVYAGVYLPDGKSFVSGAFDGTAKLWDLESGTTLRTMSGHDGLVLSVAVDPAGRTIASGGLDKTIKLWDVPTKTSNATWQYADTAIIGVDVSVDGLRAAILSQAGTVTAGTAVAGTVEVRDLASGMVLQQFTLGGRRPTGIALAGDGTKAVIGDEGGFVTVADLVSDAALDVASGKGITELGVHAAAVRGVAVSPDGRFLHTVAGDGRAARWDLNRSLIAGSEPHAEAITAIAASIGNSRVATGDAQGIVRLWNPADGALIGKWDPLPAAVKALLLSRDGRRVLALLTNDEWRLLEVEQPEPIATGTSPHATLHPDGTQWAVADGQTVRWSKPDGTENVEVELPAAPGPIRQLLFAPDGLTLQALCDGKQFAVWTLAQPEAVATRELPIDAVRFDLSADGMRIGLIDASGAAVIAAADGSDAEIQSIATGLTDVLGASGTLQLSRDGKQFLATDAKGGSRLFESSGEFIQGWRSEAVPVLFEDGRRTAIAAPGHRLVVETVARQWTHVADNQAVYAFALSANGSQYLTAGSDGAVKVWNAGNGDPIRQFKPVGAPVHAVSFGPNQQQVAAATDAGLFVWNAGNGQLQWKSDGEIAWQTVEFNRAGDTLMVGGASGVLAAFDAAAPNPQPADAPLRAPSQTLQEHTALVNGLKFIGESRDALSSSADGTVKRWPIARAGIAANLTGHGGEIYGLAFSPDGKTLASAAADKTVRLWELPTGKALRTLPEQPGTAYAVRFLPSGTDVLVAAADGAVRMYAVGDGSLLRQWDGASQALYCLDVDPTGQRLAAAGVDRTVFVWPTAGGQPQRLVGHNDEIYAVAFHPTQNRLLSLGYSGLLIEWDLAAGEPLQRRELPLIGFTATYSPDGREIAVSGNDHKTHFVPAAP